MKHVCCPSNWVSLIIPVKLLSLESLLISMLPNSMAKCLRGVSEIKLPFWHKIAGWLWWTDLKWPRSDPCFLTSMHLYSLLFLVWLELVTSSTRWNVAKIMGCHSHDCITLYKTHSRDSTCRLDEADGPVEETHMARKCGCPLRTAWNLQPTTSKELSELGKQSLPHLSLQVRTQPRKALIAALWNSKQIAQLICGWIPDPQKLWHNKYLFCLSC